MRPDESESCLKNSVCHRQKPWTHSSGCVDRNHYDGQRSRPRLQWTLGNTPTSLSCRVQSCLFRSGSAAFCVNYTAVHLYSPVVLRSVWMTNGGEMQKLMQRLCLRGVILSLRRYYFFFYFFFDQLSRGQWVLNVVSGCSSTGAPMGSARMDCTGKHKNTRDKLGVTVDWVIYCVWLTKSSGSR